MPSMKIEGRVVGVLVKLREHFMAADDSKAREATMLEALTVLETYLNTHEITVHFFMAAVEAVEGWDWEYQLTEIRNLPEKT